MSARIVSAALALVVSLTLNASASRREPPVPAGKLLGGMAEMVRAGSAFDQRLEYLVPGYREGDLVYFVMLDGSPTPARRGALEGLGASVRWRFRAIDAYSVRSRADAALAIARLPWVEYLYPVRTYRSLATTSQEISGTITRETTPQVHQLGHRGRVPKGTTSITVDLAVAPPVSPTFDVNLTDYPQATLWRNARPVFTQPAQLDQISFRYHEGGEPLPQNGWRLEIEYRNAANPPPQSEEFTYDGAVDFSDEGAAPIDPAPVPEGACAGEPDRAAWRQNANLPRRGVTDIGAVTLWERGITGAGVRLAVADTGVDETHADLDDQDWEHWDDAGCPTKVIAQASFFGGMRRPNQPDIDGHGTHVAGEAAGTAEGADGSGNGTFPGVAPDASVIDTQIAYALTGLNDDIMGGLEWAIIDQRADVVNLSFGIDIRFGSLNDNHDPQGLQSNALTTNPAWGYPTLVVAAGNSGDIFDSMSVPGSASWALGVAASIKDWDAVMPPAGGECSTDREGVPAEDGHIHPSTVYFSSRGPSQDLQLKPNVTAPGRRIMAAESNFRLEQDDPGPHSYFCASGTSMAAPHAAGSAALLVDAYRQTFGNDGPFANRPPNWVVRSALNNTTAAFADRPDDLEVPPNAAGQRLEYGPGPGTGGVVQLYGDEDSREAHTPDAVTDPVGSLVEGAGRINLPEAVRAITEGVTIFTDPSGRDLASAGQTQIDGGRLTPGRPAQRTLVLHPALERDYQVSFSIASGAPSREVRAMPSSWVNVPAAATILDGRESRIPVSLRAPAGAEPGYYSTYLFAEVRSDGFAQTLRLPVFAVVEARDGDADEGVTAQGAYEGGILALQPSTFPGNPGLLTGASSDYPLFPFRVREGDTVRIAAWQTIDSLDELDLFVYRGSIAIEHTYDPVPGLPTTEDSPAVVELSGLEPGPYLVAVNNTYPECPEAYCDWFELPYRIEIDRIAGG